MDGKQQGKEKRTIQTEHAKKTNAYIPYNHVQFRLGI